MFSDNQDTQPEVLTAEVLGAPKPPPTLQEIAEGRIGNGGAMPFHLQETLTETVLRERRENQSKLKKAREDAYEEGVRDSLQTIAGLESKLLKVTAKLVETLEAGEKPSKDDLTLLKIGVASMESAKNRALGKPTTRVETNTHSTFLAAIIRGGALDA